MSPVNLFSIDPFLERLLQCLPDERLNTMAIVSKRMLIFTDREKITRDGEKIQRINSNRYSSLYDLGYRKMETVVNLLLRNPDQVKFLYLWKFEMSSLDLSSILAASHSLKKLETLDLRACKQITDDSVSALSKELPQLETLGLSNCDQITDASLFSIVTGMQSLKVLFIQCCHKITIVGVRRLCTDLPNLQGIYISNSVRITQDDYFRLREDFPHIRILR